LQNHLDAFRDVLFKLLLQRVNVIAGGNPAFAPDDNDISRRWLFKSRGICTLSFADGGNDLAGAEF